MACFTGNGQGSKLLFLDDERLKDLKAFEILVRLERLWLFIEVVFANEKADEGGGRER